MCFQSQEIIQVIGRDSIKNSTRNPVEDLVGHEISDVWAGTAEEFPPSLGQGIFQRIQEGGQPFRAQRRAHCHPGLVVRGAQRGGQAAPHVLHEPHLGVHPRRRQRVLPGVQPPSELADVFEDRLALAEHGAAAQLQHGQLAEGQRGLERRELLPREALVREGHARQVEGQPDGLRPSRDVEVHQFRCRPGSIVLSNLGVVAHPCKVVLHCGGGL
mmetsp:Transcript_35447/g.61328  ORF Transcript_35447/g.61328 Transcript_35447/m.61328 type:complete len:215 (+) Transcript_35447:629-1273(+)